MLDSGFNRSLMTIKSDEWLTERKRKAQHPKQVVEQAGRELIEWLENHPFHQKKKYRKKLTVFREF